MSFGSAGCIDGAGGASSGIDTTWWYGSTDHLPHGNEWVVLPPCADNVPTRHAGNGEAGCAARDRVTTATNSAVYEAVSATKDGSALCGRPATRVIPPPPLEADAAAPRPHPSGPATSSRATVTIASSVSTTAEATHQTQTASIVQISR